MNPVEARFERCRIYKRHYYFVSSRCGLFVERGLIISSLPIHRAPRVYYALVARQLPRTSRLSLFLYQKSYRFYLRLPARSAEKGTLVDRWAIVVFWIRRVRVQGTLQRRGVERLWDEDNQSSNVFTAIDPDVDDGSWNCRLA